MSHPSIAIADALVVVLNSHDFNVNFEAERAYRPVKELTGSTVQSVMVIPGEPTIAFRDRGHLQWDQPIAIVIQKKFSTPYTIAMVDEYMDLAALIAEHLRGNWPLSDADARLLSITHDPMFVPEHLDQFNQITTVVTCVARVTGG